MQTEILERSRLSESAMLKRFDAANQARSRDPRATDVP